MMGQCRADRKQSVIERGAELGNVHELGFELGTPIAQGYWRRLCLKLCCLKEDDRHARSMAVPRSPSQGILPKWNLHCVMVIYVFGNECMESKIGSAVELLGVMRGQTLHHISGLVGLQCRNGMQGTAGLSSHCVCFAHKPRCKLTGL